MAKSTANPIISHENKYIYFFIPKVACTTIRNLLARAEGLEWHHPWDVVQTKFKYTTLEQSTNKKYNGYFKFAFVRNPWDRLVSCYFDKVVGSRSMSNNRVIKNGEYKAFKQQYKRDFKTMTFPEFAEMVSQLDEESSNGHFRSQYTYLHVDELDFIGRFENLQNDLSKLKQRFNISVEEKHLLKSSHKNYKQYYDKKLKNMIANRYKKDIDLFKYTF